MPPTDYGVLTTMIAPALFMTATGSLILSSNNRVARIVDRIRVLIDRLDAISKPSSTDDCPELRKKFYYDEMQSLHRRSLRIRTASALLYLAFALFVAASLLIGLDLFLSIRAPSVPIVLALGGAAALLWASVNLFQEARTALRVVDLEIEFIHNLRVERERLAASGAEATTEI
jgi:hypothetical protein